MLREQAQPLNPQYYRTAPELMVKEYQGCRGQEAGGRRQEKGHQGYSIQGLGARSQEQEYRSYRGEGEEYRVSGEVQNLYEVPKVAWAQYSQSLQQTPIYAARR
jgi:hypothetical protein